METNTYCKLLTVDEAREILKVGKNVMYTQVKAPGFPAMKIGKQIRIPLDKLLLWISNQAS